MAPGHLYILVPRLKIVEKAAKRSCVSEVHVAFLAAEASHPEVKGKKELQRVIISVHTIWIHLVIYDRYGKIIPSPYC